MKNINQHKIASLIIVIWYLVGITGFSIPTLMPIFQTLTPFGMLAAAIVLFYFHQPWRTKSILVFAGIALIGFMAELIGVNTNLIFGQYQYGQVLGFKVFNTPLLIGINWLVLVYCISAMAKAIRHKWYFVLLGALLMVGFDWLMEPVAVATEMWTWHAGQIPIKNYRDWMIISVLLFLIIQVFKIEINNPIAKILLLMQTIFFLALNLIFRFFL
jgi:putative membrane protein